MPLLLGETGRDPLSYGVGEEIRLTLRADGAPRGAAVRWRRTGDDGVCFEGQGAASPPVEIATSLSRPGFVRVEADLLSSGGEPLARFEGGAGADVRAIAPDTPEPPDFDAFWARRKAALAAVPIDGSAVCREIPSGRPDVRLFDVALPCPGGRPSTGLLSIPAGGGRFPAMIRFRGYEASWSKIARKSPPPEALRTDAMVFFLSAHGFEFNREPEYYARLREASGSNGFDVAFDPAQNSSPETAYFGGIAWRVMRGVEYLKSRPEWDGATLVAFGGSLGGLQSIWAAALCEGVTLCRPRIPWCCNMAGPAAGRAHGEWFVPWVPALAFYDPVNMARCIPETCRVEISQAGLGDYISPPSGIMAFYNALRCPKSASFVQGGRHYSFPDRPWQVSTLHD
ncbi:MAG: acetylxylan esterase [Kiritimatiellae bacterium]|nr:acetylxylan esterase [Kiritimatiellia bacterium]